MGKPILPWLWHFGDNGTSVTMSETELTGRILDFTGTGPTLYHDTQAISQLEPDSERDISGEIYKPNALSPLQLIPLLPVHDKAGEGIRREDTLESF